MTKRGGVSYLRSVRTALASALMLASSFIAPLTAYANPILKEAEAVSATFSTTESYQARVTSLRLNVTASSHPTAVRFIVDGTTSIAGERIVSESDSESSSIWRPAENPTSGSILTGEVEVEGVAHEATNQVTLYANPSLALQGYTSPQGGSGNLAVIGSAQDAQGASSITAKLLRSGGEVASQPVSARGDNIVLAQFPLAGLETGEYQVVLMAADAAGELIPSVDTSVAINTTIPRVMAITVGSDPIYAGRAFTVSGTSSAPAGSSALLEYSGQQVPMGLGGDGSFSYTFSNGLSAGQYQFSLILRDSLGNINETSRLPGETVTIMITAPPSPVDVSEDQDVLPAYIPPVAITPVRSLSTEFTLPVTSSLVASSKRGNILGSAQVRGDHEDAEHSNIEGVVDLTVEEPPATPLAPTSGGWSLFGVSWYWLAGSVAAAWMAGMGLRTWLRKP